jgi:hypothetical protein
VVSEKFWSILAMARIGGSHAALRTWNGAFQPMTSAKSSASEVARLSRAVWLQIVIMTAIVAIGLPLLGLSISFTSNISLLAIGLVDLGLIWFYRRVRGDETIAGPLEAVGQLLVIMLLGLLLTYLATATALPYRDAELNAIDRWLGVERHQFRTLVASVPGLPNLLDLAYLSIQPQTPLVPFILVITRQLPRLLRFVFAFGLALVMTSLIAIFVPAISASIYIDLAPLREAGIPPGIYTHIPTLQALRSGAMTVIQLNDFEGLITFPSFHTTIAILFTWALWRVPVVRFFGLIVNGLMILSTPLSGSHYVIDLVGGGMVAMIAIGIANRIGRYGESELPRPSSPRSCPGPAGAS